jgi:hypothetical protein
MTGKSGSQHADRRSERLTHEVLVSVIGPHHSYSGWGTNLSLNGVFVNAPEAELAEASAGTSVDVLLQLPGQSECKLKGRIVRAQARGSGVVDQGMGIEFLDLDKATSERIASMMARLRADLASV